jgi:hypothetical protein
MSALASEVTVSPPIMSQPPSVCSRHSCNINSDVSPAHPQFRARPRVRFSPRPPARLRLLAPRARRASRLSLLPPTAPGSNPSRNSPARFANSAASAAASNFPACSMSPESSSTNPASRSYSRNHRDSRRHAGRRPRRGVARDRPPSPRQHEARVARPAHSFCPARRLQRIPPLLFATRFSPTELSTTRASRTRPHPPRNRKTAPHHPGIPARISAPPRRRRRRAGRAHHHPRRTLRHPHQGSSRNAACKA